MANPFIDCPKHGMQTYESVCGHLKKSFDQGMLPQFHRMEGLLPTWVCKNCMEEESIRLYAQVTYEDLEALDSLPANQADQLVDDFSKTYKKLERSAICEECIAEYNLRKARQENQDPPFKPYENTLTFLNRDKVNELKELLSTTFGFESVLQPDIGMRFPCLKVEYGAITYPLTIKIFRITKHEEQQEILEFIERFYEVILQKQRIIRFYRDMTWIRKEEKGHGVSLRFDPQQELLLEKEVY